MTSKSRDDDPRFDLVAKNPITEMRFLLCVDDQAEALTSDVADLRKAFIEMWEALEAAEAQVCKWAPNRKVEDEVNAARWRAAVIAMRPDRLADISDAPADPLAA